MTQSLFERIGGAPAVEATVTRFYEKVLADPILVPFFKNTDMEKQRRSQIAFITYAFGGPNRYTGQSLRNVHKKAVDNGLNDRHFDAVAGHLQSTMQELGVPADLIKEAITIAASTRKDVLNK